MTEKCSCKLKTKTIRRIVRASDIRTGTAIEKWYRLNTKTKAGVKIPDYKWDDLNAVITAYSKKPCGMSEDGYIAFIQNVVSQNPNIITEK